MAAELAQDLALRLGLDAFGDHLQPERLRQLDDRVDHRARVGAGVSLEALGAATARKGLFYAPDPTEWTASVGGTIATNASGSRSFRYGDTRRHVLALRVVLAQLLATVGGDPERLSQDVPRVVNAIVRAVRVQYLLAGESAGDLTASLTRILAELGVGEGK